MSYWINTITCDHVNLGIQGGFTQASHGKRAGLLKLDQGDFITFYSSRTEYHGGDPLQSFTALGRIVDEEPYQVEMRPDFHPWRRQVEFLDSNVAPIAPLIEELDFIKDKIHWGLPFRQGLFEVERNDFKRIVRAMRTDIKVKS